MNFLELLVKKGIINRYQLDQVIEKSTKEEKTIEEVLFEMGISNEDILATKSQYYDVPQKQVDDSIETSIVELIPRETAETYQMVPVGRSDDDRIEIGMLDPRNIEAKNVLQFIASKNNIVYKIVVITENDFNKIMGENKSALSGEIGDALNTYVDIDASASEVITKPSDETAGAGAESKPMVEDAPVTKMVAAVIRHAVQQGASDIHFEHLGEMVRIRFRIDGELTTYLEVPKNVHSAMIARIKIMTQTMKLDERRKPQDGRFPAKIDGRKVDFRVSIMPTFFGEKVVMRILDAQKGIRPLDKLGLTETQEKLIREAINKPYGLILVTGPTGSGKTTTLYSFLGEVDKEHKNVVSLEDPIEYQFPGVSQSQVRADIGYTFSAGLRSIVRQDPDVIMVGEIRDTETAKLAIEAALTGHLVFATLHTNSSFGAIPRLVDMGVDPYLIAPTLELSVAQRLLRRMCDGAGEPVEKADSVKTMITDQFADLPEEFRSQLDLDRPLLNATPTKDCPAGTKGRVAILEMFQVDKEIEEIILDDPSEIKIYQAARKKGMLTLKEDAILKGLDGIVPFNEVNKL